VLIWIGSISEVLGDDRPGHNPHIGMFKKNKQKNYHLHTYFIRKWNPSPVGFWAPGRLLLTSAGGIHQQLHRLPARRRAVHRPSAKGLYRIVLYCITYFLEVTFFSWRKKKIEFFSIR
jgi:hypothetical protein